MDQSLLDLSNPAAANETIPSPSPEMIKEESLGLALTMSNGDSTENIATGGGCSEFVGMPSSISSFIDLASDATLGIGSPNF